MILAIIFLCVIILDKTCRTVPMMLVANSCLAGLIYGSDLFGMALFALQNDLKQIEFQDSLCIFRGYLSYMMIVIQSYSYLLQAIYRYLVIVYPTRLFYQSARFQVFLIFLTWICGIIYPIPVVFTDQIKYNVDSHMCQVPLSLSFLIFFSASYAYLIPMGAIAFIYFKMVRYVKQMSARVTPVNILFRARRELKMVRRIISLISILVALGLPYAIFIFMSFFNNAPKYHFRIAYTFVDVALAFVMIALFEITQPLKASVMKKINGRQTMVVTAMT